MLNSVDRFRRLLTGTALIASGGAIVVSLATKTVNSSDEKDVLDSVAANPGLNTTSSLAQLVMAVLMLPAIFGLLHLLRHRGAWLGHVGAALLLLNLVGNAVDVGHGSALTGLIKDGVSAEDVAVLTNSHTDAAFIMASLFILVGMLGFPVLAAALWRNGVVSRAVPGLIIVAVVSFFFPIPEAVGGVLLATALGWTGGRLLRGPDREWTDGWNAAPAVSVAVEARVA